MFHDWETFYLLIDTSAAALVGVMFIVTTLTAEIEIDTINRGVVIYQNPLVFHLGGTFAASAVILLSGLRSSPSAFHVNAQRSRSKNENGAAWAPF